ncbi:ABC transporter family substrate-binding protein [Streptomyces sp. NBC_01408]|uniref:ABC transporter family substrate-binding protein n=1 Tax=Streptomyces sp. NBC_01408 TaxID=2903855 RepID=UPI0022518B80|nr:ABC transporter substrate-binding protein [Streptomyces sp. NBC_01408]MCX4691217.1 ABC transporter substrate-binding protein [Streptomyces sp. NBC_01408]
MSQRRRRSLALLTSGVLALPLLTGCGAGDDEGGPAAAGQDIATTARDKVADGGVLRWAVDSLPNTLNTFQADSDATTTRIAGAVLPQLFVLDAKGRPVANPDYLEKAEVVEREPKQVVLYKLNQQAVWSDGREIGAADFVAQWRALNGKDSAYWTARNAGYDRIEKIERGKTDLEVRVTFAKPYADWRALFTPLYPKQVTGTPDAFNEGARGALKVTAGPFGLGAIDKKTGTAALTRNPRWWGQPAKLDTLVLTAVPRSGRPAALAAGKLDLAEIDRAGADRIALARREAKAGAGAGSGGAPAHGPAAAVTPAQATLSWAIAFGADEEKAAAEKENRLKKAEAEKRYAAEQKALRTFTVRKSLEPAYTQLAMNGASGPLADERVRRAVARALDRKALAEAVLKPLGLPAKPVGSHLALAGQRAYADNSDALGGQDTQAAQALLADAGWRRGGKLTEPSGAKAGPESAPQDDAKTPSGPGTGSDGLYIVGQDDGRNGELRSATADLAGALAAGPAGAPGTRPGDHGLGHRPDGSAAGTDAGAFAAYGPQSGPSPVLAPAPFAAQQKASILAQAAALAQAVPADDGKSVPARDGEAADPAKASPPPAKQAVRTSGNMLAKDGKPLTLRFVLPSGPGSEALRTVGERIAAMLQKLGVQTETTKVADESFFKDHIASGQYDLALYSWPATAYPATDARPIFAKPEPAADGSLLVEQNYTRVGTDHIDQLFDQAVGELDEGQSRELMRKADARIWAAAGSIPLYQRPELVAVKPGLANAGAFGLGSPRFQDIGWKKPPSAKDKKK